MSSPLRMRLTLWFVGAFSVVLIVFSLGVYFFVERILRERLRERPSLPRPDRCGARHRWASAGKKTGQLSFGLAPSCFSSSCFEGAAVL